jgi:hypothetical protein
MINATYLGHAALLSSGRRSKAGASSSASRSMAPCQCASEQTSMRGGEMTIRRQLSGSLNWLAANIVVGDCDYGRQAFVQFIGKAQAERWLQDRFADHDSVVVRRLYNANADQPIGVIGLDWTRTSDTLSALG